MKNYKILIISIVATIIIILIIIIMLLKLMPTLIDEEENLNYGDVLDIQQENTYKVYKIVTNCIEKYIMLYNNSKEKLSYILEEKRKIGTEEIAEQNYVKINEIYKIERMDDTTYFVEALINNEQQHYLINVDYRTNAFNMRKIEIKEFKNAKENNVAEKYKKSIQIELNQNNAINVKEDAERQIADKYYSKYIQMALSDKEIAFQMLEATYRKEKFDNKIENYEKYIKEVEERLLNAQISKVTTNKNGEYTEYKIEDIYKDNYVIKEYNYMDFTIEKLEESENTEEYANASSKEKVIININKIFKMIDNKEYEKIYKYLNEEFRENNFTTLEEFEDYIKVQFFDYNFIGNITIKEQGQNYIATVPYKSGINAAAERNEKIFVVRLLEENKFEISFEI